jgi:hypothetical protein
VSAPTQRGRKSAGARRSRRVRSRVIRDVRISNAHLARTTVLRAGNYSTR